MLTELPAGRAGANPAGENQAINPAGVINSLLSPSFATGWAVPLGTAPRAGSEQTCLRVEATASVKDISTAEKNSCVANSYRIILIAVCSARNRWKCR